MAETQTENDYTRDDLARAWEEGHEVCEWPGCAKRHPNPYGEFRARAIGSITHGATGLDEAAEIDDMAEDCGHHPEWFRRHECRHPDCAGTGSSGRR